MERAKAIVVTPMDGCRFSPEAGQRIKEKSPGLRIIQNETRMTIEGPEAQINSLRERFQILGLDVNED